MLTIMLPVGVPMGMRAPRAAGQGLGDEVGHAGAGRDGGVTHGTRFHAGDADGHAHHHLGAALEAAAQLGDEIAQHAFGDAVVGHHTVAHGANDFDGLGGAAQHGPRLVAHRQDLVGHQRDCHHRGLIEHDTLAVDSDDHVDRAEVNTYLLAEHRPS
jgi:hypothetical protein